MSNLVEHARRELELLGEDEALSASLVACVAAFASFGHSGASAACAVDHLARLLRFETLTPIGTTDDEWIDQSDVSGTPMWQNRRNPAIFSTDAGATSYDVNQPKIQA